MIDVLALYRLRWQIELAFKRLKSLAGLDLLPARSAALGRAWIAAKLIIATLIGWTIQGFLAVISVKLAMPTHPPSVWCLFNLTFNHILNLIWRPDKPPKSRSNIPPCSDRSATPPANDQSRSQPQSHFA